MSESSRYFIHRVKEFIEMHFKKSLLIFMFQTFVCKWHVLGKGLDFVLTVFPSQSAIIPGPPFLFGACSVLLALLVALFIPEHPHIGTRAGSWKKPTSPHGHPHSPHPPGEAKEPLLQDTNVWLGVLMWLYWPRPLTLTNELRMEAVVTYWNVRLYIGGTLSLAPRALPSCRVLNSPIKWKLQTGVWTLLEGKSQWLRLGVPAVSWIEHHFLKEMYIEEHIFNDGSVQRHYCNGLYLFFLLFVFLPFSFQVALFFDCLVLHYHSSLRDINPVRNVSEHSVFPLSEGPSENILAYKQTTGFIRETQADRICTNRL